MWIVNQDEEYFEMLCKKLLVAGIGKIPVDIIIKNDECRIKGKLHSLGEKAIYCNFIKNIIDIPYSKIHTIHLPLLVTHWMSFGYIETKDGVEAEREHEKKYLEQVASEMPVAIEKWLKKQESNAKN